MQYFSIVHEHKRYFNWFIVSEALLYFLGKTYHTTHIMEIKYSSVLSSCMASCNNAVTKERATKGWQQCRPCLHFRVQICWPYCSKTSIHYTKILILVLLEPHTNTHTQTQHTPHWSHPGNSIQQVTFTPRRDVLVTTAGGNTGTGTWPASPRLCVVCVVCESVGRGNGKLSVHTMS